jgi:hypothetical protein
MHACDNISELSRELVLLAISYNCGIAGVLYRFVPKRGSLRPNQLNRSKTFARRPREIPRLFSR